MAKVLYESEYTKERHFSFGRNWRDFLLSVTPRRIAIAEQSLTEFLGGSKALKGKTFIDIGCGSGLFSLAAYRLGARVTSVDVDDNSLMCAQALHQSEGKPKHWKIVRGSALDDELRNRFGRFDIVYSWGVLHHTGDMQHAIRNASELVNPDGQLYIALYNHSTSWMHGTSPFWHRVKEHYNASSALVKQCYVALYSVYLFVGLCMTLKNPFRYIAEYQTMRGMSWRHDILDWLGGHPYEYAEPAEVIAYLSELGFTLQKIHTVTTIACNEYVFVRNKPMKKLPAITVLLSAYNSADTLDKTLQSVFDQTFRPHVVCVDDASTDATPEVLMRWRKKFGRSMHVITNKKNMGLTRSLNKGLKVATTPYVARIDADDWWDPRKLELQANFLVANPEYGVVGTWYTNYTHTKSIAYRPNVTDRQIRHALLYQNQFAHSCIVFDRRLIRKLGGYDATVKYGQDYELWMRCLPHTKFFNLPLNLCHRSFVGGISIEKQKDQMKYAIQTRLKYIRKYRLPLMSYRSIVEPALVWLTPRWLANAKRKIAG
jgi:glycosyltransferase involved in cell wall biosynthesis/2-polyprenyl-3-methyl-5-hydroxy-6-metoxy-1,4-benzoquinol methylase